MELNLMAEAIASVASDNPDSGTVSDAPLAHMTVREGDAAIANLLGNLVGDPQDNPNDAEPGNEADTPEPDSEEPHEDNPEEGDEQPEDVDPENPEEQPDDEELAAQGRFVTDDAKAKLDDGSTVTLSELKQGYLRQRDYSQKTEALSRDKAGISQAQERMLREINVIREFALATMPQRPEMPTEPAEVNPVAWSRYAQQQAEYDNMVQWANHLEESQKAEVSERQKAFEAKRDAAVQANLAKIDQTYGLKTEAKRNEFWEGLGSRAATHYGVPKDEVRKLNDPLVVRILQDALKYRDGQSKLTQVKQGVETRPVMVNGSGKRQNAGQIEAKQRTQRLQRLRETGSVRDADSVILDFLK